MDPTIPQILCPHCASPVTTDEFFCPHCGRKLKDPPPSTSAYHIVMSSLAAVFLPPVGIFTGMKYLKQPEERSKNVGALLIGLTVVSLIVTVWSAVVAVQDGQKIINQQLGGANSGLLQGNQPNNSGFIDQQLGL